MSVDALLKSRVRVPAGIPRLEKGVSQFLRERLGYYLEGVRGMRYDTVRAAMAVRWGNPLERLRCAEGLEQVRDSPDFEAVSVAAKRIKNILTKSASPEDLTNFGTFDPNELEAGPERRLWEAYVSVSDAVSSRRQVGDYAAAFQVMAGLRPFVDEFFDKVLVIAPDRDVRRRRLQLLQLFDDLFSAIADLSQIESVTSNVVGASTSEKQMPGTGG